MAVIADGPPVRLLLSVAVRSGVVTDEKLGAASAVDPDGIAVIAPRASLHALAVPGEFPANRDLSHPVDRASMVPPVP